MSDQEFAGSFALSLACIVAVGVVWLILLRRPARREDGTGGNPDFSPEHSDLNECGPKVGFVTTFTSGAAVFTKNYRGGVVAKDRELRVGGIASISLEEVLNEHRSRVSCFTDTGHIPKGGPSLFDCAEREQTYWTNLARFRPGFWQAICWRILHCFVRSGITGGPADIRPDGPDAVPQEIYQQLLALGFTPLGVYWEAIGFFRAFRQREFYSAKDQCFATVFWL